MAVVAAIIDGDGRLLQPWLQQSWQESRDDSQRLRVALDQVASLTDASVERWYWAISG
jgi:dGTP triphosphohydrolase